MNFGRWTIDYGGWTMDVGEKNFIVYSPTSIVKSLISFQIILHVGNIHLNLVNYCILCSREIGFGLIHF